jgi:hypothetical protein
VTPVTGLAGAAGHTDGVGSGALFQNPYGVTVDNAGHVYVADTFNNRISKGAAALPCWTWRPQGRTSC